MKYNDNGIWKDLTVKVSDTLPIGTVIPFAGNTVPSDWMVCDGSAISRTVYSTLFGVIGTSFGEGDGETTFNIPDLQGKVAVGVDSEDTDFDTLGETGGEKTHTLTVDEMPSHNHELGYSNASVELVANGIDKGEAGRGTTSSSPKWYTFNAGGGQSHNNLQPYQVVNYIIKATKTVTGEYISETLPIGTELDFDGEVSDIPDGWEQTTDVNTYSTNEIQTGKTWVDGKPIYRKTLTGNTGSARVNVQQSILTDSTIDVVTNAEGVCKNKTASSKAYILAFSDTLALVYDTAGSNINQLILFMNNSSAATFDYWITIEYTKKTDQGGNS